MKRGWMALVALVLVASAVPLLQVMYDRSGAPRATFLLTQRELDRSWHRSERTGERLHWNWGQYPTIDSVTTDQLAEIGLRCEEGARDCARRRGRSGYVVVALDTLSWRKELARLQGRIDSITAIVPQDSAMAYEVRELGVAQGRVRDHDSRLRAVDAGRDAEALFAKWNDGAHLVLPARLVASRMNYPGETDSTEARLYDITAEPQPGQLYVPNRWAEVVRDTSTATSDGWDRRAKFNVVVGVGRGWLPRVIEMTPP